MYYHYTKEPSIFSIGSNVIQFFFPYKFFAGFDWPNFSNHTQLNNIENIWANRTQNAKHINVHRILLFMVSVLPFGWANVARALWELLARVIFGLEIVQQLFAVFGRRQNFILKLCNWIYRSICCLVQINSTTLPLTFHNRHPVRRATSGWLPPNWEIPYREWCA